MLAQTRGTAVRQQESPEQLRESAGLTAELEDEAPDLERVFLDLTGRALRDQEEA